MSTPLASAKRTIAIERTYQASIEDVWELWTTKAGIESWWGPDGFAVTVQKLELRVGGELDYTMTATAPPQVEFMKRAGMPLASESRITFKEITPPKRLVYGHSVTFVPGVDQYSVDTVVELSVSGPNVRLVLTIDAMHDDVWTERAVMGWKSELEKLAKQLSLRPSA
jgi:uncharacterized protein YndB with AHSA1/START domain